MGVMVNAWTPVLLAWIAICVIVVGVMPTPRGRGLDAVGLGALLVPLTGMYLWAFGITASFDSWAQVAAATPGGSPTWASVSTPGFLFGTTTIKQAFLIGMVIVGVAAAVTVRAPRQAAYLAAASLVAFGLVEAVTAIVCNPQINDYHWWDWLLWAWSTWRAGVWVVAFASLTAGFWLSRRTIVADLRAGRALTARVERLTETRAEVVDSAAAELRRLERDLHDGAQARLVALGINLRTAERMIRTNPDAAVALVAECRETSSHALSDLRNLVRGIYPPVLADRGLGDAVQALALDCPVPVVTEISLPGRPPAPVESAVYFAVAEALNNVAKHSDATCALVRLVYGDGMLRAEITDDGNGGADTRNGTGLAGIERRLGAFDGILAVNSPVGGPTIVVIEVPCALSSLKISTC
jgi:signal transduction histidine kinase